ncbi:MAG: hypothetical protein JKY65_19965 [Planctomycetes bacterium]|nr:hypothetical protein [Planctomycetota bacterium]
MSGSQLRLFGLPPEPLGAVGPAEIPKDLHALGERLPSDLRLGTSSWSFSGWEGLVYDRPAPSPTLAREGLAAYARHPLFRTVGLDRGYYAPFDRVVDADLDARDDLGELLGASGRPRYLIVNNKAEGCAPRSIAALAQRLADAGPDPEEVHD